MAIPPLLTMNLDPSAWVNAYAQTRSLAQQRERSLQDMALEREKMDMLKAQQAQEAKLKEAQIGEMDLKNLKQHVGAIRSFLPSLTKDQYDKFYGWNTKAQPMLGGMLAGPEKVSQFDEKQWEDYKSSLITGADDLMRMAAKESGMDHEGLENLKLANKLKYQAEMKKYRPDFVKKSEHDMLQKMYTDQDTTLKLVGSIDASIDQLKDEMFTGPGAAVFTKIGEALSSWFGYDKFADRAANTRSYLAEAGNRVGAVIKQFGAGTGLSDADREYAKMIAGGDISITKQGLRSILAGQKRAAIIEQQRRAEMAGEFMGKEDYQGSRYDFPVPEMGDAQTITEKADSIIESGDFQSGIRDLMGVFGFKTAKSAGDFLKKHAERQKKEISEKPSMVERDDGVTLTKDSDPAQVDKWLQDNADKILQERGGKLTPVEKESSVPATVPEMIYKTPSGGYPKRKQGQSMLDYVKEHGSQYPQLWEMYKEYKAKK